MECYNAFLASASASASALLLFLRRRLRLNHNSLNHLPLNPLSSFLHNSSPPPSSSSIPKIVQYTLGICDYSSMSAGPVTVTLSESKREEFSELQVLALLLLLRLLLMLPLLLHPPLVYPESHCSAGPVHAHASAAGTCERARCM